MSQTTNDTVTLKVGQEAPGFTASAVVDGEIKVINLSDYKGQYIVLFFYPLDFTFVCPTEIIGFSDDVEEFKKRNAVVLGVSVDSVYTHLAWINTPRSKGGLGKINYPLVADLNKRISKSYDALYLDTGHTLRALFLIDPEGIIRHITLNDPPVGRNTKEVMRLIDAFDLHKKTGNVCPINWQKGDDTIKPDPNGKLSYFRKKRK